MNTAFRIFLLAITVPQLLLLSGCLTTEGVERRQERIDARTAARLERYKIREAHEDARADARFDAWANSD